MNKMCILMVECCAGADANILMDDKEHNRSYSWMGSSLQWPCRRWDCQCEFLLFGNAILNLFELSLQIRPSHDDA